MIVSGGLFLAVYFIVFVLFNHAFPGYALLSGISRSSRGFGWLLPLEELMFAFTFGLYWSSIYEHLMWRRERAHALSTELAALSGRVPKNAANQ